MKFSTEFQTGTFIDQVLGSSNIAIRDVSLLFPLILSLLVLKRERKKN